MPNLSFSAFNVGVIALVVQLAAHTILSSGRISWLFTPYTMFLIFPLAGAVNNTLAAPLILNADQAQLRLSRSQCYQQ